MPIDKMWERIEVAREDSDTSLFLHLMYLGEMVTKTIVAGLVAAIVDDRDRHRYRLLHRLVRADGLGEWRVSWYHGESVAAYQPLTDVILQETHDGTCEAVISHEERGGKEKIEDGR
jgi:hypothetical protein